MGACPWPLLRAAQSHWRPLRAPCRPPGLAQRGLELAQGHTATRGAPHKELCSHPAPLFAWAPPLPGSPPGCSGPRGSPASELPPALPGSWNHKPPPRQVTPLASGGAGPNLLCSCSMDRHRRPRPGRSRAARQAAWWVTAHPGFHPSNRPQGQQSAGAWGRGGLSSARSQTRKGRAAAGSCGRRGCRAVLTAPQNQEEKPRWPKGRLCCAGQTLGLSFPGRGKWAPLCQSA